MRGRDLRCPKCGGPAVDVAPDYDLDRAGFGRILGVPYLVAPDLFTSARCARGHHFCLASEFQDDGTVTHHYSPEVFDP